MYKVFVDNIPIYFENEENFYSNLPNQYFPVLAPEKYNNFVKHAEFIDRNEKAVVKSSNSQATFETFFSDFKYIEAAGGLVFNPLKNKYLFIERNGVWDIPKGKIEKGENNEDAAIREVQEECGFNELELGKLIMETYHTYFAFGKYHLKKTYWYNMKSTEASNLKPQKEEGITELIWLEKENWDIIRENTFLSIQEVMNNILET